MFKRKNKMIKVRLIYVCQTAGYRTTKDIEVPFIQEGMQISQIFNSVITGNDEGEIFTVKQVRYLLKDNIYIAFLTKEKYHQDDKEQFDSSWQIS